MEKEKGQERGEFLTRLNGEPESKGSTKGPLPFLMGTKGGRDIGGGGV